MRKKNIFTSETWWYDWFWEWKIHSPQKHDDTKQNILVPKTYLPLTVLVLTKFLWKTGDNFCCEQFKRSVKQLARSVGGCPVQKQIASIRSLFRNWVSVKTKAKGSTRGDGMVHRIVDLQYFSVWRQIKKLQLCNLGIDFAKFRANSEMLQNYGYIFESLITFLLSITSLKNNNKSFCFDKK